MKKTKKKWNKVVMNRSLCIMKINSFQNCHHLKNGLGTVFTQKIVSTLTINEKETTEIKWNFEAEWLYYKTYSNNLNCIVLFTA